MCGAAGRAALPFVGDAAAAQLPRSQPHPPALPPPQYTDNTNGAPGVPATLNELQLYVINLTGGTIRAGTDMWLTLSIGTLNNPSLATA